MGKPRSQTVQKKGQNMDHFGLHPTQDAIVTNEGLGWDSLILKMVHNPGADEPASWAGVVPMDHHSIQKCSQFSRMAFLLERIFRYPKQKTLNKCR